MQTKLVIYLSQKKWTCPASVALIALTIGIFSGTPVPRRCSRHPSTCPKTVGWQQKKKTGHVNGKIKMEHTSNLTACLRKSSTPY